MSSLKKLAAEVLFRGATILVAFLPEEFKKDERLSPYVLPSAHFISGIAESFACAALFITGLIDFVTSFGELHGWTYLSKQPQPGYGDFFGVGLIGFFSYLLHPASLLLVYCVGEGIVRCVEVGLTGRLPGVGVAWAVYRGWLLLHRQSARARVAVLLGPARPDELVLPRESRRHMLEIYSIEEKPWRETQVVELGGEFFQLASRQLLRRGAHHTYQYLLHPLEAREVIRGTVVPYEPPHDNPVRDPAAGFRSEPHAHNAVLPQPLPKPNGAKTKQ